MERFPTVQRRNKWLNDRHGAIVGTSITPGFKRVRERNMPVTTLRGFVVIETAMNSEGYFLEVLSEAKVDWRTIHWIPVEDDEHFDLPRFHILHKFAER